MSEGFSHDIEGALSRIRIDGGAAASSNERAREGENFWSVANVAPGPPRSHGNITVDGDARVHIGDSYYLREASPSQNNEPSRSSFIGSYAHSSLHPVSSYVSRPDLECQLRERLPPLSDRINPSETRTVVVWGLGGVGKSQLVRDYIHKHRQHYKRIFWLEAGQKQTLERDFILIHSLLFDYVDESVNGSVNRIVAAVKSWLHAQEGQTLWVMDSADTVEDAEDPSYIDLDHYLPHAPGLDIIVTTRSSRVQSMSTLGAIAVSEMSENEAMQLFRTCAKLSDISYETDQTVREIAQELGCLALAVTLAGAYVYESHWRSSDLSQYLQDYRTQRKHILSQHARRHEHQYSYSVLNAWEMSFAAVERQSIVAARLLHLVAFLNFDDIFLSLFTLPGNQCNDEPPSSRTKHTSRWKAFFGTVTSKRRSLKTTHKLSEREDISWDVLLSPDETAVTFDAIEAGFKTLEAYSLVSWRIDQTAYAMHKLVHAWGHDRLDTNQQQVWSVAAMRLLSEAASREQKNLPSQRRMVPHVVANISATSEACLTTYTMTKRECSALKSLGDLLSQVGRWNDEYDARLFEVQNRTATFGKEDRNTLAAMHSLGIVMEQQGRHRQAEEVHRETLKLQMKILGTKHNDTLESMDELAGVLFGQGKYHQAEETLQQMLKLNKKILGVEHPNTVLNMIVLAASLLYQGKTNQADDLTRQILELNTETSGTQHPEALRNMRSFALLLVAQGKGEQAEDMLRQALELRRKTRGVEDSQMTPTMDALALVLRDRGKYSQAEDLYRQTLELNQRMIGAEHPHTVKNMDDLAVTLKKQRKYEQAEELHLQALEITRRTLGAGNPLTLEIMENLASTLWDYGKHEEADLLNQEIRAIEIDQQNLY